ncbi:MAG TPA: hypothetical protein VF657_22910 [Actinoplanes sp.]
MTTDDVHTTDLLTRLDASGAGSLAAMSNELTGPFTGAVTPQPVPFDDVPAAEVTVPRGTRYPLVLVTLLSDLSGERIVAVPRLLTGTSGTDQPPVTFDAWTQAGSSMPGFVPVVDSSGAAGEFRIAVTAGRTAADGSRSALSADEVRAILRVDLVQGLTGRVLAAAMVEKARLRRCGREIAAMRVLTQARDDALDRLGADLGCSRFADELVWDPVRRSPGTRPLSPPGRREDDASYRSRLALLRGLRMPTPDRVDRLLNGTGPGTGRLADVGFTGRIEADETPDVVHLALRLVAPGSPEGRVTLLDAIRQEHLIWAAGSADGDTAHSRRLVTRRVADRTGAIRDALARWSLPAAQPVAPALAGALRTLDARCAELGARPWPAVVAGQHDAGGSRFELGFGASLAPPDPAALDAAVAAAEALGDPGLVPRPRSADPIGAWLLAASGLRTFEPVPDGSVFVSTLPMGPLVVELAPGPDSPPPLAVTGRLISATDAAHDSPLVAVVTAVRIRQRLRPTGDVGALLAAIQPASAAPAAAQALGTQGVPVVTDVSGFGRQLSTVSDRLYAAFDLGPAGTEALTTDPAVLAAVLTTAAGAGASSVVAVVTATGTVALLFGVTGLPLAGSNLAGRQTVLFRWQIRGLAGAAGQLDPKRGPATEIYTTGTGISVLSCIAHVRGPGNDPYEWSPAPAGGALLNLRQYEHLMNLIELATPVGVRANTWVLRQRHLDVDGSGTPTPLTAAAARTYRHYRVTR